MKLLDFVGFGAVWGYWAPQGIDEASLYMKVYAVYFNGTDIDAALLAKSLTAFTMRENAYAQVDRRYGDWVLACADSVLAAIQSVDVSQFMTQVVAVAEATPLMQDYRRAANALPLKLLALESPEDCAGVIKTLARRHSVVSSSAEIVKPVISRRQRRSLRRAKLHRRARLLACAA